ncbi:MAG TPA: serine hydrolase [Spirosoma sp.]|nr:serine hydrolase [Spirosoma sp.]
MAVCFFSGSVNQVNAQGTPALLSAKVDALFAEWNKPGSPGAAVGVVHQGKLIYAKGFGEADLETGARIGPETIFHIASVSKQFTAYAIVLLAQEGKLSFDDDIRVYLPEVPDFGKKITIRHLIYHTSGLRDQWALLAMAGWQMDDVITKQHIINLVKRQRELNFDPGTEFSYSNTNYTLLAEIASRVGKQPFSDWMREHVFTPLGMKNTQFYDDHERIVKNRAYSFYKDPNSSSSVYRKSVLSYANVGATGLFTTVTDLVKWVATFQKMQVGKPTTMGQMLERGRLTKGDTLPYSFALFHGKYKGLDQYGHDGADAGYRSFMCYFPKADYGFIVLSNAAELNPAQSAYAMADIYLANQVKEDKSNKPAAKIADARGYQVDGKRLDQYLGDYQLAPGFVLSFKREGDRFMGQATGQPPFELSALSDTTFYLKVVEARVTFHKPVNGNVTRLTWHQNGDHPAMRVEAFTLSKEQLQVYTGKYYSPELETIYTINLTNDTLKLAHVHYGETTLKPVAKDRFETSWRLLQSFYLTQSIALVRNANEEIIGMRISNGRVRNVWFKRLAADFEGDKSPMANK